MYIFSLSHFQKGLNIAKLLQLNLFAHGEGIGVIEINQSCDERIKQLLFIREFIESEYIDFHIITKNYYFSRYFEGVLFFIRRGGVGGVYLYLIILSE